MLKFLFNKTSFNFVYNYMSYDRLSAVKYAKNWWNKRNPKFYNFDSLGGDCTNFICQCLLAGGFKMKESVTSGWFYKSLNYRSPSFSGVNELFGFGINNNSSLGVKFKKILLKEAKIGDIIQLRQNPNRFNHSLIITSINNNEVINSKNIYVSTHTIDCYDRCLCDYNYFEYRCLRPI